jgi:hypothetical protein
MARRIALGAVLGVLLVAAPAGATVVPELGAVTTVNASGPSWIPVQLKQPARLDLLAEQAVEAKVTGEGRVRGFVLRLDADGKDQPGFGGFTYSDEPTAFAAPLSQIPHANFQERHIYYDLPAGAYRLYVLADGPAQLQLTLPGLGPNVTLTADQPADYKAVEIPRLDSTPVTNMAVWGTGVTLSTMGLIDSEIDIDSDLGLFDRSETCEYTPGHDFSGSDAFTRGCPGADDPGADPSYAGDPWIPPSSGSYGIGIFEPSSPPGKYGVGGNLLLAGAPPTVATSVEALSYGAAGLPPGYALNPPAPPAEKATKKKHRAKHRCSAKRKRAHKCGAKRRKKR